VAAGFHWPLAEILDLEHPDRRRFVTALQKFTDQPEERE
jgi:hypothetical protein